MTDLEALNLLIATADKVTSARLDYLQQTLGINKLFLSEEFNQLKQGLRYLRDNSGFDPSTADLSEFLNESEDPFLQVSGLPPYIENKGDVYICQANGAGYSNLGFINPVQTGATGSNLFAVFGNYLTNPSGTWNRRIVQSSTTAGNSAELYWTNLLSAVGLGFYFSFKVQFNNSLLSRFFVGVTNNVVSFGNINPSTELNIVGFGIDSNDTNLHIINNNNTGLASKIDLGSDFIIENSNAYICELFNLKNSNSVFFKVKNLKNDKEVINEINTKLPNINTGLSPRLYCNNGVNNIASSLIFSNLTYKRES
jgi:hypothetical protein